MASKVSTATLVLYLAALASDTVKMGLLKNTYTPNPDHNFVDDVASHETTASGYTGGFGGGGRKTLASKTISENATDDTVVYDAADPASWTALGSGDTLRYAFVCKEVTNDAASPLIAVLDMQADKILNGGDLTLAINSAGIFTIDCT
jgi:hypothetical protein